ARLVHEHDGVDDAEERSCEPAVGLTVQHQARVRVPGGRVEAAGDEKELWSMHPERREDDSLEGRLVCSDAGSRRQRHVDVRDRGLVDAAGCGREAIRLVERDGENVRTPGKRGLRAVAVVRIPVDDRDPFYPVYGPGVERSESDVAEETSAYALAGQGMVARRAHECIRVGRATLDDGVDGDETCPHCERRDFETAAPDADGFARVSMP